MQRIVDELVAQLSWGYPDRFVPHTFQYDIVVQIYNQVVQRTFEQFSWVRCIILIDWEWICYQDR